MKAESELIVGFSESEVERISIHLRKLLPHLVQNGFTIVGGLAIRYHLTSKGIYYPERPFNDLDIVAESSSVLLPSVTDDFMIYHYHPERNGSFFIALVEPISKTKVDIFDSSVGPENTVTVRFEGYELKIQSTEDQLVKTVFDLQRISEEKKVDPKQFSDARLLMQISDIKLANEIWQRKNFKDLPANITEAIERAEKIAKEHPEWLKEKPFKKESPYLCDDCEYNPDFPLAPMDKVYKVLGFVE